MKHNLKPTIAFPLVLLCSTVILRGQAGSEKQLKLEELIRASQAIQAGTSAACPVSVRAQHGTGAGMLEAKGAPPKGVGQAVHLSVADPERRQIVAANVTVRGLSNKARMVPVQSNQPVSDASRTMDVRFILDDDRERADLRVPGLSATSSVELNSVAYADGSTWKAEAGSVCRTPIDGFMLVDMR